MALGLTALLLAPACTGDDSANSTTTLPSAVTTTTAPPRENDGILRIGVFLPRTGPGAALGESMTAEIEQAVADINAAGGVLGNPVELAAIDEGGGTGPSALLTEDVDAIIGPASSTVALSQLSPVVQPSTGVVTCSPSATALLLDDYPDNGFFFRTVPSDSLQMAAIARRAREQGVQSVAVGFLDDPYGRGLVDAFTDEIRARSGTIVAEVGFSADEENLEPVVERLLSDDPGVVVILGDGDDGGRLLTALDEAPASASVRRFIVNDSIRTATATVQGLSANFRTRLTAIAPLATTVREDGPEGFFTAHAVDCLNLIALAALSAGSDDPDLVRVRMAPSGSGGRACRDFEGCAQLIEENLDINYEGLSGAVELSNSAGNLVRGWFEAFSFAEDGSETGNQPFEVIG